MGKIRRIIIAAVLAAGLAGGFAAQAAVATAPAVAMFHNDGNPSMFHND